MLRIVRVCINWNIQIESCPARPHLSLRLRLEHPERKSRGSLRKMRPRTLAMAAGLTDHIWSVYVILIASWGMKIT